MRVQPKKSLVRLYTSIACKPHNNEYFYSIDKLVMVN